MRHHVWQRGGTREGAARYDETQAFMKGKQGLHKKAARVSHPPSPTAYASDCAHKHTCSPPC